MYLRRLDILSPPITLYYKGERSHYSICSGIMTIICYIICLTFAVFYAYQFFIKANPQVCSYTRYVEDAGEFPVNSSSMFSFIQIYDTVKNIPDVVDFDLITIVGLEETVDIYQDSNDLTKYNHWIYGYCNNSTDIQGIKNLVTFDKFTESACIRKYYNKDDNKYYNTNEKGFIWPNILHGCSHPNRTFYGIVVEKCRNTTLKFLSDGKYCKPKEEIIKYIKKSSINFQLIDQFSDILNHTVPYRKYFYGISNGLFEESYTTNHLNLNPTKIISDEGNFFENKKETLSYFFELNEKVTTSSGDSGIYVAFYFWMQNRMQYYERVYDKVQDIFANVGGLCNIVITIAEFINIIINRYTNIFDTQIYMNEIQNSKIYDKNIFRFNDLVKINEKQNLNVSLNQKNNNIIPAYQSDNNFNININNNKNNENNNIKNDKNNINDNNNSNSNNNNNNINIINKNINNSNTDVNNKIINNNINNDSGNKTNICNGEIDIVNNKQKKIKSKKKFKRSSVDIRGFTGFKNDIQNTENISNINKIRKTDKSLSIKSNRQLIYKDNNNSKSKDILNNNNNNNLINNFFTNKEKNIIETQEPKENNIQKTNNQISFIHYLNYLVTLNKPKSYIHVYSDFRFKMISEENLILSNLNINKILNKYKSENSFVVQDIENYPKLNLN